MFPVRYIKLKDILVLKKKPRAKAISSYYTSSSSLGKERGYSKRTISKLVNIELFVSTRPRKRSKSLVKLDLDLSNNIFIPFEFDLKIKLEA